MQVVELHCNQANMHTEVGNILSREQARKMKQE